MSSTGTTRRVGISGLGRMGLAMAERLLEQGFGVVGFDIDPARRDALAAAGGQTVQSNADLTEGADGLVTCLPSSEALQAVLDGPGGLRGASANSPLPLLECSTLAIDDKLNAREEAGARHLEMLDCPLSGGPPAARQGQLAIFASGPDAAVAACAPVLEALSRQCHHVGEFGNGTKMKFLANLLVAVHNVSTAEVLTLGVKAGFDPAYLCEVLATTSGDSKMLRRRGPKMATRDFGSDGGISLETFDKDLRLIAEFGRDLDCPLPLLSTAEQLYVGALAQGLGEADSSAVFLAIERLAGLQDPRSAGGPARGGEETAP